MSILDKIQIELETKKSNEIRFVNATVIKMESKDVGNGCNQLAMWENLEYITKEQENDSSYSNLGACRHLEFSLPEAAFHTNESSYICNKDLIDSSQVFGF